MLVFVDESGDAGLKFKRGSSELMTVLLVVFEEEQARAMDDRIHRLRVELQRPAHFEFHFVENSDHIREAFFQAIAPLPFLYTGMVINKTRLHTPDYDSKGFYKDVCGSVFEQAKPLLQDANIKIDKSGGQGFRRELTAHLKRRVNTTESECHIKQVTMKDSKGDNLLQVADMICGAVTRSYRVDRDHPDRFRKIIAHHEVGVRLWPE